MSFDDELFGDVDKVAQPQKLENTDIVNKNKQSLFKHFKQVEDSLNEIQDNLQNIHMLFNELGDGSVDENLPLQRRNDIINKLTDYQYKVRDTTSKLNQYLNEDLTSVRGLRVVRSTSTNAFDELLNKQSSKKLSSKDLSFQRKK
ncbi:hypothetical protein [Staphylococcus capitis]|uniref:Syntaxin N-terminal domain-containing protein n=1 Tax=Staphylococcus capitis TaxID=29388 RepID=A0ABX1SQB4_STACP|nr:hypothetical protein [Staphylococcus capitis]NMK53979.1 hypothetical protein [Staphylococcus capitis]NMK69328.1 hypothetical protein [Staphylococcus capitis]